MLYYILPYLCMIVFSVVSLKVKGNGYKILFLIGFIPAVIIVFFRGLTGTDTYTYIEILNSSQSQLSFSENYYNLEGFFLFYAQLIKYANIDPQLALNLFGLIICFFIYKNLNITKHAYIIFASLVFPVFFYDMTMNGVRYGLAFALMIPFILEPLGQSLKFNKNKIYLLFSLLNHNSAFMFIFLKLVVYLNFRNFIFSLVFLISVLYLLQDYLLLKIEGYSDFKSPSIMSGLQPLFLMFLIVVLNSIFFKKNLKRNIFLFLLQLVFYSLAQFTYAGLRFQFLVLFFTMICLVGDVQCKNYNFYLLCIYIIGILGFILKMRNMINDYGVGFSPFLPYVFQ